MAEAENLDPATFSLEGGPVGVLLIHGFTGAPPEMRLVGDYLNERGVTVLGPLLPGHGTTCEDLNDYGRADWIAAAGQAMAELRDKCDIVFVGGLSMGAMLTLYLAENDPDLPGIITYAPLSGVRDWRRHLAPVLKRLFKTVSKGDDYYADPECESNIWSYETYPTAASLEVIDFVGDVKDDLAKINCPLLIFHATGDPSVASESGRYTHDHVSSPDKELVILENSGHVLTVDAEWEMVAEKSYEFIRERIPEEMRGQLGSSSSPTKRIVERPSLFNQKSKIEN
jgi:carboxylesterase